MFELNEIRRWLGLEVEENTMTFLRVHTDSRTVKPGDLFVALKGERFDAHDFLPEISAVGNCAAIVDETAVIPDGLPVIKVKNTLTALQCVAQKWRERFQIPTIAVTGSNGKTTVKEMLAHIGLTWLGEAGVIATQGNLNNDIGVPLSVLRLKENHQLAIFELGMNHIGEIGVIAPIASPTVALVNNAQREHQEFMGTIENVARENGQVFGSLRDNGVAVYPLQPEYVKIWQGQALEHWQVIFAVAKDENSARTLQEDATKQWRRPVAVVYPLSEGRSLKQSMKILMPALPFKDLTAIDVHYEIQLLGEHNIANSAAAFVCAYCAGVPLEKIVQALSDFEPVNGRMQLIESSDKRTLINDTYNANPDSVIAAIRAMLDIPGRHLLVLGDMGEVGDQGVSYHCEVAKFAKESGIQALFVMGDLAKHCVETFGEGAQHFMDMSKLQKAVLEWITPAHGSDHPVVLVKGSRFMAMERVFEVL